MNFQAIRILCYNQESAICANRYSKFQLWVCKTFRITPERKYYFTVKASINNECQLKKGDILQAVDGTNWVVLKSNSGAITLQSVKPYSSYHIEGVAVFIAMSYMEGSN